MASFKFKPLSTADTFMRVLDAEGNEVDSKPLKLGEYYDVEVPEGGQVILTEASE